MSASGLDTSARFGFEWGHYRGFFPHYEEQFRGWIHPLPPEACAGWDVLDAGCGMGRNSYWAHRYGARSVLAVDAAAPAVASARRVLAGLPGVRVERACLYELDCSECFDLCLCIGVIHHLEHPRRALERLCRALRPGGRLVVWLYGYEGNELWARVQGRLRPLLRRLPPARLHALAYAVSFPLWLWLRLPLRGGPSSAAYREQLGRFPFAHLHKIVFDQLLPDVAHYYRRDEVEALFAGLPLSRVGIHHNRGYSWTVLCER